MKEPQWEQFDYVSEGNGKVQFKKHSTNELISIDMDGPTQKDFFKEIIQKGAGSIAIKRSNSTPVTIDLPNPTFRPPVLY